MFLEILPTKHFVTTTNAKVLDWQVAMLLPILTMFFTFRTIYIILGSKRVVTE
jgi:hypothetical protein